jgi:DNA-binding NarL/FixJ family response regulator
MRLRTRRPFSAGPETRFGVDSGGPTNGENFESTAAAASIAAGPEWFEGSTPRIARGPARDKPVAGADLSEPDRSSGRNVLLLLDSVRLTRECTSHLLAAHLANYEIVSLAHPHEIGDFGDLRPDAVLLNVRARRMADGAMLQDIIAILSATHHAPILLLSEYSDTAEASLAAEAGVAGLFPSNCGVALLIAAIQLVVAGGQFYAPTLLRPKGYRAREEGDAASQRRQRID